MSRPNIQPDMPQPEDAHEQPLVEQTPAEQAKAENFVDKPTDDTIIDATLPVENLANTPNYKEIDYKQADYKEIDDQLTLAEKAAGVAKEQATIAADALRRGELMQETSLDPTASKDDRLIGLLCYLSQIVIPLALPILVLLSASSQKRVFQRYHAVQSLALSGLFVLFGAAAVTSSLVLQIVPIIGQILGGMIFLLTLCLLPIATLMYWVAHLYYGYHAYQGKRFAIPGLTSLLRDQGWINS